MPHPTSLLDVGALRDLQVVFPGPGTPGERSTEAEGQDFYLPLNYFYFYFVSC